MKLRHNLPISIAKLHLIDRGLLPLAGFLILFWSTSVVADESVQPPPLQPFDDINKPTAQVVSLEDLLSFLPDILATYGHNSTVTKTQLLAEMGTGLKLAMQQGRKFSETELRSVVRHLVDAYINLASMLDMAKRDGFTPSPQAADKELETLRTQLGEEKFKEMLLMQDLSVESLSARVSQRITIESWIDRLRKSIIVTPSDIKSVFQSSQQGKTPVTQARISHVFARVADPSNFAEKAKLFVNMNSVRNGLVDGERFADLIGANSDFESNGPAGDLGFLSQNTPVPGFTDGIPDEVFSLPVDEVSGVIESPVGFHIFKVTDRKIPTEEGIIDDKTRIKIETSIRQKSLHTLVKSMHESWKNENNLRILF